MTATSIEWAKHVWNPVAGCSIKSAGCTHCYAMAMAARVERCDTRGKSPHYAGLTRKSGGRTVWTGKVASAPDHVWLAPLKRRTPTLYFVNSMGDLFHEDVPDNWIDRAFAVMALCPQHKFIVLTKRADRMREWATRAFTTEAGSDAICGWIEDIDPEADSTSWDAPLPNVALGVSVEDQATADERIADLLATPAAIRLISAEPLLGPVDFFGTSEDRKAQWDWLTGMAATMYHDGPDFDYGPRIDWVIAGGESGPGSRPCHPDWARGLRDQCAAADVPFFWKQWGDWLLTAERHLHGFNPWAFVDHLREDGPFVRVGKTKAGALLDGQLHRAAPDGWAA